MSLKNRIKVLSKIGDELKKVYLDKYSESFPGYETIFNHNPWFTTESVKYAIKEWSTLLQENNILEWISNYNIPDIYSNKTKLGIIMAGNIPFVGLHDLICGYILDTKLRIKLSSKDTVLIKWIIDLIKKFDSDFTNKINIYEYALSDFNAVIATGSNNSNRYFEYYFKSYPKILRHNRSSIAVLSGNETKKDLENLSDDIFTYFGLGCRNVSSLKVPQNYDFTSLANAFKKYEKIIDNNKYANNFNYQYTLLAMNRILHINLNNVLLIESDSLHSPVGVLNYSTYESLSQLQNDLRLAENELQCIVSNLDLNNKSIKFGQTQKPILSEYADNTDTLEFLLNLH